MPTRKDQPPPDLKYFEHARQATAAGFLLVVCAEKPTYATDEAC